MILDGLKVANSLTSQRCGARSFLEGNQWVTERLIFRDALRLYRAALCPKSFLMYSEHKNP